MRRAASIVVLIIVALMVVGFLPAMLMDAVGLSPSSSAVAAFHSIPRPVRIGLEIVIGVPILVGLLAYFILEFFELGWFITRPVAWIVEGLSDQGLSAPQCSATVLIRQHPGDGNTKPVPHSPPGCTNDEPSCLSGSQMRRAETLTI